MASIRFSPANVSGVLSQMGQSNVVDGAREERTRQDARQESRVVRDQARNDRAVEQMLRNPANAEAISKAYGVPITPELGALLQQPALAQKVLEASKLAQGMGIENPEARKIFAQKYVETGDLMQAGDAIQGIELGKPLTEYQRQSLDVARSRAARGVGGGTQRTAAIPANFIGSVENSLDRIRGVRWVDPQKKNALLPGSASPLAPETVMEIANRAAALTQQTRNPVAALSQAYGEIGGEQGLVDAEDSPFQFQDPTTGLPSGKVKYRRSSQPRAQQTIDDVMGPESENAYPVTSPAPKEEGRYSPEKTAETMQYLFQDDPDAAGLVQNLQSLPGTSDTQSISPNVPVKSPRQFNPMEGAWGAAKLGVEAPPARSINNEAVKVNTPDEARALPPGTKFVTPDGRTKIR